MDTTREYLSRVIDRNAMIALYMRLLGNTLLPHEEVVALADRARVQLIAEIAAGSEVFAHPGTSFPGTMPAGPARPADDG